MLSSDRLEPLLYRHDPLSLRRMGAPADEYAPEARTIADRLNEAETAEDVQRIMHEEFVRWFDAETAGEAERYAAPASEAWVLLTAARG